MSEETELTDTEKIRDLDKENDALRDAVSKAWESSTKTNELLEYADLLFDAIARLVVMSGYPALEAIFPDPETLTRVTQLKSELFPTERGEP